MALMNTSAGVGGMLPSEYGDLVAKPVGDMSVAIQTGTEVSCGTAEYHVPVVDSDAATGAVAEGAEITPSDATFSELIVTPAKFAGLSIISREFGSDTSPAAAETLGRSLARSIANSVDNAYLNSLGGVNPPGLADLVGISAVSAPAAFANLDPFEEALNAVETAGGNVTAWITGPSRSLEIAQLKEASGSNRGLLTPDATAEGRRLILGRPVFVSPHCPADVTYGVSKTDAQIVVREGTAIEVDKSAFFTSDRWAVKGIMRVGFAFPVPAAMAKITNAAV